MNIEHLHIRTNDRIKAMLQQQATDSHRSMTEQIEYLIDQEQKRIENLKGVK